MVEHPDSSLESERLQQDGAEERGQDRPCERIELTLELTPSEARALAANIAKGASFHLEAGVAHTHSAPFASDYYHRLSRVGQQAHKVLAIAMKEGKADARLS